MSKIKVVLGDIVSLSCDCIVNAANPSLLGGGGVDGAIHASAGRQLLDECKLLGGCDVGEAKITNGFNLKAKFVIHAVGPIWYGGNDGEIEKLSSCYREAFKLCVANNIRNVAFPCISTGCYNFPNDLAAKIAIKEVRLFFKEFNEIEEVILCCFLEDDYKIYNNLLNSLAGKIKMLF